MLIDTHCHLDHVRFKDDIDKVIENARKAGVSKIITNGINPETNRLSLELAKRFDIVKAALGIYPVLQLKREIEEGGYPLGPNVFDIDEELEFIEKQKPIAIGEIGLDYSEADDKEKADQKETFIKLLELAEKLKVPAIIHSRKAEQDVIDILQTTKAKPILHCFCGKKRLIKEGADLGYTFTVPTNVVKSQNIQLIAELVNINQLLTETDAPYLSPFQGRNEPAFIIEAVNKIAEIKGFTVEETKNNIWMNYSSLF